MLVNAGPLDAPAGGSRYHQRMVAELRQLGWSVRVLELPGPWPAGSADLRVARARHDEAIWLVDGLAFPALVDALPPAVVLHHLPLRYEHPDWAEREERALSRARRIIVTSPWAARDLGRPAEVVVPGTDACPTLRAPEPGRVLVVGTVCPRKAQLEVAGPGVRLAGAAEGDYALACAAAGATLLGPLGPTELDEEYARAELFVQASRWETWGMALCEALARGLPVVARDLPATRALAPHAIVHDLPGAMVALQSDADARAANAAASRAAGQRLPSWEVQAARLAEVLREERIG